MGQCLKCGKEAVGKAIFCSECQADMELHPIKPGAVVHLLQRPAVSDKKAQRYNEPTQEQQLKKLQKGVRFLLGLVALLSVLLIATAILLLRTLNEETPVVPIGRNYTTIDTTQ